MIRKGWFRSISKFRLPAVRLLYCTIIFCAVFHIFSKTAFAASDHLLINEVYPNPSLESTEEMNKSEWIELVNQSDQDIFLSGYTIEDANIEAKLKNDPLNYKPFVLDSYTILAHSFLLLKKENFLFTLNDGGEKIILRKNGIIVDWVGYGTIDGEKQPYSAPESGQSLTRYKTAGVAEVPDDFVVAAPTPMAEYFKPDYSNDIIISEILPNPLEGLEFIELLNKSDSSIDLGKWKIKDASGRTYAFLADSKIEPGEYIILDHTKSGISLNDVGFESVQLLDPNSDVKSMISYDKAIKGQSYSLFDNGWQWTEKPTPGEKNQLVAAKEEIDNSDIISIADARNLENGEDVVITGTVTTLPGVLSSSYFYIQDGTGGIQVYCYYKTFPTLVLGDVISVTGELSQTNNERRIKIDSIEKIVILNHTDPVVPLEIAISEIGEKNEGTYIKTAGIVTETSGDTFHISDGQSEIKVVINKATNIDKPKMKKGDQVEVTGIVSQYKDEYRILPIDQDDVKIVASKDQLPRSGIGEFIYFIISAFITAIWNIFQKAKKKPIKSQKILLKKRSRAIFLRWKEIWEAVKPPLLKGLPRLLELKMKLPALRSYY